jgi:carboxylate-amine ligase
MPVLIIEAINGIPSAAHLRRVFDVISPLTIGLEEEVMLLDPVTLDLLPRASEVLARCAGDERVKGELPASQLELVTPPVATVGAAANALRAARRRLAAAAEGIGLLAASGAHPFTAPEGELSGGERYERIAREYGWVARRQLVCGLHVHVAVRPAAKALAVYNALRSYLPQLSLLAATAPFHAGADTGLQSIRPKLGENLPRQGVPPAFVSFEELAGALRWAAKAGAISDVRQWWWELRLHPRYGTLEVRVCDAQPTVALTAALAAVIHALCGWLGERHDAGDLPPPAPAWRIDENRWSACRHGVQGTLADLVTGEAGPARERLSALLDDLGPAAGRLGCLDELVAAGHRIAHPVADRHRAIAAQGGLAGLCAWLAARFCD